MEPLAVYNAGGLKEPGDVPQDLQVKLKLPVNEVDMVVRRPIEGAVLSFMLPLMGEIKGAERAGYPH